MSDQLRQRIRRRIIELTAEKATVECDMADPNPIIAELFTIRYWEVSAALKELKSILEEIPDVPASEPIPAKAPRRIA